MGRDWQKHRMGPVAALVTGIASIVVLVCLLPQLIRSVREQYYLSKLASKDERVKKDAAMHLGELHSTRAIAPLLDLMRERENDQVPDYEFEDALALVGPPAVAPVLAEMRRVCRAKDLSGSMPSFWGVFRYHLVLTMIGEPAMPALLKALIEGSPNLSFSAAETLSSIYGDDRFKNKRGRGTPWQKIVPFLEALRDDAGLGTDVRRAAAEALISIKTGSKS